MIARQFLLAAFSGGMVASGGPLVALPVCAWLPWLNCSPTLVLFWFSGIGLVVFLGVFASHLGNYLAAEVRYEQDLNAETVESLKIKNEQARATLAQQLQAAIIATDDDDAPDYQAWVAALKLWFRAGDRLGFGKRDLAPAIVTGPEWARLQAFYLSDAGWGVLHWIGGSAVTEWAEGWNLPTVLAALDDGRLPHPAGDPPTVHIPVYSTQTEHKNTESGRGRAAAEVVIDQP